MSSDEVRRTSEWSSEKRLICGTIKLSNEWMGGCGYEWWGVIVCVYLLTRSEAVEREQVLRTRAMRERDETRNIVRYYRYTLLRIRLPDGLLLQGKNLCCIFFTWAVTKGEYRAVSVTEQSLRQLGHCSWITWLHVSTLWTKSLESLLIHLHCCTQLHSLVCKFGIKYWICEVPKISL